MKTFLFRAFVTALVACGILALVVVVRMAVVEAPPRPDGEPRPFAFPQADAVERLAEALRIPTVSHEDPGERDPEAWLELHRHLEASFPRVHEELEVETVSRLSLLLTWPGSDPDLRPILFGAHQDVVPVPEENLEDWTHPPFAGVVADGYVWGRGALDMKGPLMGILEAVEGLLAEGLRPRRTVIFAFGHDEEVGGREGAARITELLRERGVRPEWVLEEAGAVVTEMLPGLRDPVALVATAEKGYMTLRLEARTEAGHSSAPPRDTAIGTVARGLARLEENPFPARLEGPVRGMLQTLAPHMDPGTRMLTANLWLLGPLVARALGAEPTTGALVRTTMAPTVFRAGVKENVLPARASATVNVRIAPWDTPESVVERVRGLLEGLELEVGVSEELTPPIPASPVSSTETAGYRSIRETIHVVFPDVIAVAPILTIVATDGRHYGRIADDVYRFAPYRAGPETLERIHGVDERISVAGYLEMVRFYAELLRRSVEGG